MVERKKEKREKRGESEEIDKEREWLVTELLAGWRLKICVNQKTKTYSVAVG